jgi:hypothetical protein
LTKHYGEGHPAGRQEALQSDACGFRFEILAGAAGVKLGRIDCAQPNPGRDLETGPDAYSRLERIAVDNAQHVRPVGRLWIEFGKTIAGPRESAAFAGRTRKRIGTGRRVKDRTGEEPQSENDPDDRQHTAKRPAGPPVRQMGRGPKAFHALPESTTEKWIPAFRKDHAPPKIEVTMRFD